MAGIAQVWLTHNELEALAAMFDVLEAEGYREESPIWTPHWTVARDKIEMALKPVACEIASGPKTPARPGCGRLVCPPTNDCMACR